MYNGSDELTFTRAFSAAIKAQASLRLSHIGSEIQATDQFMINQLVN